MKKIRQIESYIVVISFALICILIFFQVINRTFFKMPIIWLEETARYLMVWMAFISAAIAFRKGVHISVTFLEDKFKSVAKNILFIFQSIVILAFLSFLTYGAWKVISVQIATNQTTPALGINIGYIYFAIPLWAVLTGIEVLYSLWDRYKQIGCGVTNK